RQAGPQLHAASEEENQAGAAFGKPGCDAQAERGEGGGDSSRYESLPVGSDLPGRRGREGNLQFVLCGGTDGRTGSRAGNVLRYVDLWSCHAEAAVRGEAGSDSANHAGGPAAAFRSAHANPGRS